MVPVASSREIVGDEEFSYDDAGGLLWKKDGNGKFTLYQYDDLRRLIAVYYLPGALPNPISYEGLTAGVTYTYHGGASQRETMTDAAGTSAFGYDAQGRLSQYTPPLGLDTGYYIEYAYNNAGQKTGVKIWNGTTASYDVSYEYYANGWLKAVKYGGNTIASYSYDAVGNRTRVDYGNGTYTTFGYESGDPRYRLETITHKLETTALATFGYTRDDVGNPLSFTSLEGAWAYTYDAMNRLASATPPSVPLPADAGGTYSYDWVGNMKAAAASNAWTYNAADQLTLWPGMHSYEYDDNGALTAVKTADGSVTQQSFTHHPSGLMNTASFGGQTLSNLWDADEHRVQFSIGEDDYTAVFDVTAGIPAVIKEVTPQGTVYYVREPGGELLAMVHPTSGIRYYHFDDLGSTRLLTNSAGAVTDSYTYDAYGSILSHDRNTGTIEQPYQYVGQLGYYTHYQAPELGWLQLGVRFYDPESGLFERRDPVPVLGTAYAYAAARPLAAVDPSGYVCYICTRNLEMPCGLGAIVPLLHVFIWCDREAGQLGPWRPGRPRPGYDRSDPVIGYGPGGIGTFDREYFENRSLGASRRLDCQPLDSRLEPCIRRRIRHDLDRSQPNYTWPGSQFDIVRHNCQHYVDDILRGCGGYSLGSR